ncbi:MAG: VWA-like domain-containing protein, partial [Eubacteriales bacterium]|nr:VWA-like domain-containing protein [Eubacteriales bacterium]
MGNRVELDQMGRRILDAARTELYLSMRFLGPALHSLDFVMDLSTTSVGTDAANIRFNPNYLFRLYVDRPRLLNRTYLHMLLHCVFRHMFTARQKEDRELWDLACDIAVGSIIDSMEYRAVEELTPEYRQKIYDRLEKEIHVLTAERIYQYFIERKRNYLEELQMRAAFALCDHSFWERMEEDEDTGRDRQGDDETSNPDSPEPQSESNPEQTEEEKDAAPERPGEGNRENRNRQNDRANNRDRDGRENSRDPLRDPRARRTEHRARNLKKTEQLDQREQDWKETSRRMEAELLASGREASQERGSLERILAISNRRRTDYREFLRRFAVLREVTTVDPDSFDYGFYHYGLEMYGNMPLIEENEYREMNRIRTLVLAIDTSASCQQVLVQRFVNETAAVLRSIGQFFHTTEVHLLECDEHVQQERVFHSPEELERYADNFRVRGGFGTDFRPVFSWIEEKRRTGEIRDLAGLMYFTDGMGVYPEKPTDYDTAFVFFNDEELDDSKVPDWAIRLYIDGERLKVK